MGLCCAKLGEAEALAAEGLGPLLITSPLVGPRKLHRLAQIALGSPGLTVVVDDVAATEAVALALAAAGPVIDVLVDLDPGTARTGAATTEAVLAVARAVDGGGPTSAFAACSATPARSSTSPRRARRRRERSERRSSGPSQPSRPPSCPARS